MNGIENDDGFQAPGLLDLLDLLYLSKYVQLSNESKPVKKCLMFIRTEQHMVEVYDQLRDKLPYVMNHDGIGPITSDHILKKRTSTPFSCQQSYTCISILISLTVFAVTLPY